MFSSDTLCGMTASSTAGPTGQPETLLLIFHIFFIVFPLPTGGLGKPLQECHKGGRGKGLAIQILEWGGPAPSPWGQRCVKILPIPSYL